MNVSFDHLVVAAETLQQGAQYIRSRLGVDIDMGGRHDMMATHNKVMSLGEGVYLEVISINSQMPPPDQPRWFALDDPMVRESLKVKPRLLTWAVNTADLNRLAANSATPLGVIRDARRDSLKWRVAVTEDGRMPASGFLPLCIQWKIDFHPSERMQNSGCRFRSMTLYHPRKTWLQRQLESIGADNLVTVVEIEDGEIPWMESCIVSPSGEAVLSSK